ncbi:Valine--tRNA ligase [Orchesella cincta]|uniref:Valine--tRNA ligase n=1 Tax=Orchesella cincta TaxID=48709 RepID=A0A1D2NMC1_ORCCI|nr:Valine--tRNA ligase [Orchesella cincta]
MSEPVPPKDSNQNSGLEGPKISGDNEVVPEIPQVPGDGTDPVLDAKKAKELKKKLEKEAKMKKFLEKQQKQPGKDAAPSAEPKKAKPDKSKGKEKISVDELIKTLEQTPSGNRKPTDGVLPDAYEPRYVETSWYEWWVKQGFFKPEYGLNGSTMREAIDKRGKFVMVIPPPNVTGTLHLGHALMCTLEDVLTRWNRMCGKVTLWVPGCDHAGIATQMVVEKTLARKEGKTRHDLGRPEFIKRVWEWKDQKGDRIYEQLKKMGISADWDRAAFTMDDKLSNAVRRAFVNLFEGGYIYRSNRLVNWSCTLKSAISDIEVDKVELTGRTLLSVPGYKEKVEFGVITSFAYKIDDETEIVVATTRPETMLGDTAIAVHPEDPRYAKLVGKKAKHPFVDRDLIIVADDFVDREFGTGAVKITPAHDPNDYDCGKRNDLEFITVIDENGLMMENCGIFSGMKRFDARKAVIEELKKLNLLRGDKDNPMVVPVCSRSKDIVEPLLKPQWYVACSGMAKEALELVEAGRIRIVPELHKRTWVHWMETIRDWCISRQLWWGHQIPAYRVTADGVTADKDIWVAAESDEEALSKATEKYPEYKNIKLQRDEDVLDTWFSSGLFPFSVFGWPDDTDDLAHFYPTDLLETGHDIIFFWVSRMIFMAATLTKNIPFKDVFLHSLVRDAHGRKMSKSLGNVIDPLDVIRGINLENLHKQLEEGNLDPKEVEKAKLGQKQDYPNGIPECGTDALRFSLCACMTQGKDINLDVLRCQGYRFFCNKIWNAVKFSLHYFTMGDYIPSEKSPTESGRKPSQFDRMERWILGKLSKAAGIANDALTQYNFQDSTTAVYNFWLYEFCDVYLESLKPKFMDTKPGDKLSENQILSLDVLLQCVEGGLRMLSPFMPYLSEELWQRLPCFAGEKSTRPESICVASYPHNQFKQFENESLEKEVTFMNHFIKTIRSARAAYEIPNKTKTEAVVINSDPTFDGVLSEEQVTLCALSYSKSIRIVKTKEDIPAGCATAVVSDKCTVYILLKGLIDLSKEEERINKKLAFDEQQITKLKEAMGKADYEEKVPSDVREKNTEKLNGLEGEVEELVKALESVKLMLSE